MKKCKMLLLLLLVLILSVSIAACSGSRGRDRNKYKDDDSDSVRPSHSISDIWNDMLNNDENDDGDNDSNQNEDETLPAETLIYENQFENYRFYVQQGYPTTADEGIETDWVVTEGNDKHYLVDFEGTYADGTGFPSYIDDCGLVASFSPAGVTNVKYNIYTLKGFFMRATLGDILIGILGKSATFGFEFNNLFTDNADRTPRDTFVWSETIENTEESIKSTTVEHNKIKFQRVAYTFTVYGIDWRGMMLVTWASQGGFHVITLETETSVWDANYPQMEQMLDDFRMIGWEIE